MINKKNVSRRNFIKQSSLSLGAAPLGLGGGIVGVSSATAMMHGAHEDKKLLREICVASVDLKGLWPDTTRESRIKRILERMEEVVGMKPDLVCMPEMFDTSWVEEAEAY